MTSYDRYLHQVMKGTYLRKREKRTLKEEMGNHLQESAERFMQDGHKEEEAYQYAIEAFGPAREIRKRIIRETFIISPRWFLLGAFLCFVAFMLSLYTMMRFDDFVTPGDVLTSNMMPNPQLVTWLHHYFPIDPSRWIGLGVVLYMLIFARKESDRAAVFISALPFCVPVLLGLVNPYVGSEVRYIFFLGWPNGVPFSIASDIGYAFVFLLGIALYMWTRNRAVSTTPWVISISLTVWPFARNVIQFALWKSTHNPIFWGHSPSGWGKGLMVVIVLFIFWWLFLWVCKWIDSFMFRKMKAT